MKQLIESLTDIYIDTKNREKSFCYPGPTPMVSHEARSIVDQSIDLAGDTTHDFLIVLHGVRFRVSRIPTIEGDFLIMRKMPQALWGLQQCGLPTQVQKMIMHERLNKGGLIVVSGMPGNGKSTTCAAIISERLSKFGGVCNTIEDPAEMPLHGFHGQGFCMQRQLSRNDSPYEAVIDTLRAYPAKVNTMMLIGEVRDAGTASLALQSAVDGRLVLITTHASSVIETVRRVTSLATDGSKGVSYKQARELFAASFRLVINQKIINDSLRVNILCDTRSAAETIRGDSDLEMLNNQVKEQRTRAQNGEASELRPI